MTKRILVLFVLMVFVFPVRGQTGKNEIIKLGTLVTEESDWGKTLSLMNAKLIERSNGEVKFQIHFGRDESDLVDLIGSKQIDAASLSVPGLGKILSEVFIFQLPLLFSTYEELDHVRDGLTPYFSQQFNQKGYTLLGWGDLGFAYLYSKVPIRTQTDLRRTTLWVMEGDLVAQEFASASGKDIALLPVQSVLSSLTRDDIQTIYGPPLGCIALQWYTQVKYLTDLPLVAGVGATIINNSRFGGLSEKHKRLVREITDEYHRQIIVRIRLSNEESIDVLKEQGIEVVSVPHQEKLKWKQIAERVKTRFLGKLYQKELLEKVETLKLEYQKNR